MWLLVYGAAAGAATGTIAGRDILKGAIIGAVLGGIAGYAAYSIGAGGEPTYTDNPYKFSKEAMSYNWSNSYCAGAAITLGLGIALTWYAAPLYAAGVLWGWGAVGTAGGTGYIVGHSVSKAASTACI